MIYVTLKQSPIYHQISFDEILKGAVDVRDYIIPNYANTRTRCVDYVNFEFRQRFDISGMIEAFAAFNAKYTTLIEADKSELYTTFYIPKKTGGLRRIDAPNTELMEALRCLKTIFEEKCFALYHTTAFAYVKKRCPIDAVKRHQQNRSKWFAKLDFTNFFGSTTFEFVHDMLAQIYPFSDIIMSPEGDKELSTALSLCFLNGGLPQGTPISPMLTNLMMIPIDHTISNSLRKYTYEVDGKEFTRQFIYTRYADDMQISSREDFSVNKVIEFVLSVLNRFNAPFTIKKEKTRYGSSSGRNWNLGVMLNKDNNITIGYQKKKQFKGMINNYITDKLNGVSWDLHDIQVMQGYINYYQSIEKDYIEYVIKHYGEKYHVNFYDMINQDLCVAR